YYLAAARRAREQYAYAEAERLYRAYLALVDAPTAESVEARNELGFDVLRVDGQIEKMAEEHAQAVDEADRLGHRTLLAQGLLKLGRAHFLLGRLPEARTYMERALGVAREVEDRKLEAMLLNGLGAIALDLESSEAALEHFEGALACYRALGNREG